MRVVIFLLSLALCLPLLAARPAFADGPADDVNTGNVIVQRALAAAQAGDLPTAQREYFSFKDQWASIEDGVRAVSRDDYRAIEAKMRDVDAAFAGSPNSSQVVTALGGLDQTQKQFVASRGSSQPALSSPAPSTAKAPASAPSGTQTATVATLLQQLSSARTSAEKGDYPAASAQVKDFQNTWPDVEGQVKTRSVTAYTQTEDDMGLAL